jgi:hypothetical protein
MDEVRMAEAAAMRHPSANPVRIRANHFGRQWVYLGMGIASFGTIGGRESFRHCHRLMKSRVSD